MVVWIVRPPKHRELGRQDCPGYVRLKMAVSFRTVAASSSARGRAGSSSYELVGSLRVYDLLSPSPTRDMFGAKSIN